jgi:hypothetical protein
MIVTLIIVIRKREGFDLDIFVPFEEPEAIFRAKPPAPVPILPVQDPGEASDPTGAG